jgi:hypothetical protein
MMPRSSQGGNSAQVKMKLLITGSSLPVAQMGPDFLLVMEAVDLPPSNAIIVMQVDDAERRWDVHLPNGISLVSKRVAISVVTEKLKLNSAKI